MARKNRSEKYNSDSKPVNHTPREVRGLLLLATSFLLFLSLISFTDGQHQTNFLGLLGYTVAWGMEYTFGLSSYLINLFLFWIGWRMLCNKANEQLFLKTLYFAILICSISILLNLINETTPEVGNYLDKHVYTERAVIYTPFPFHYERHNLGGVPFYYLYRDIPDFNLQRILSNVGVGIIFTTTTLATILLLTQSSLSAPIFFLSNLLASLWEQLKKIRLPKFSLPKIKIPWPTIPQRRQQESIIASYSPEQHNFNATAPVEEELDDIFEEPPPLPPSHSPSKPASKKTTKAALPAVADAQGKNYSEYQLPPPSLLSNARKVDQSALKKDLRRQAEVLEETLKSFNIDAKVGQINCGPTITSFEVHPAVGVKVQKIKSLENDIALNLQARSIRIIAPIPGKAVVGIEIPNPVPQDVGFKEMIIQYKSQKRKAHVPLLLGKSVSGENVISDLSKMPHLIIAGATGSGKSVCINGIIASIVMTARPDEIKMIMVDPKKVELTPYTALPHMIAPVITESDEAVKVLHWLVKEMEKRYEIFKQLGVRNITSFNHRKANPELELSLDMEIPQYMHYIVCIIDELADLMIAAGNEIEMPIARLAQMARAVGIHVILTTQRPSREVITGLIKANFPARISFKVASRINSQIILDEVGAEALMGNGDMLFLPPGTASLLRAQGAYINDDDINTLVEYLTSRYPPNYLINPSRMESTNNSLNDDEGPRDSLYGQAVETVISTGNASTTFLQRKLKIGYARAASLMDELEGNGIVGPAEGSKPRKVLANSDQPPCDTEE
ncbi:MAG: DNA translocase FtsK 4TM domain-containing protein [Chlamydiota bacterium]